MPVPESALRRGLKDTLWAGRWQIVRRANGQTVALDAAHNPAGAQTLADVWRREWATNNAALILGMMRDKDCAAICRILAPRARRIFLTPVGSERSADPAALADFCREANPSASIIVCHSIAQALARAEGEASVVVAGSIYLIGEALERLGVTPPSQERALNEYGISTGDDSRIRTVTFDVGGTLIEPWPSVGHVYSQVALRHGVRVSVEVLNQRFAAAWQARENFAHRKSDWSALVDQTFAGLAAPLLSASFFPELYEAFAEPAAWRVYDDVRPCLDRLRQTGLKLGAISNWDERLRPLLQALGLDEYFDTVIISCEAGGQKPGPEIFRLAAHQLGAPPHAILHIGDSRREDWEGARAAGFQALLLTRGAEPGANGTIASLDELAVPGAGHKLPSGVSQAALIAVNSIDRGGPVH
jgi:putative hydrolase of the HAD superfamily